MDYANLIAKLVGIVLLLWTGRSIYRHFTQRKSKPDSTAPEGKIPSLSEQLLNNLLLYLWLAFMVIFSTGMIFNN